MNIKQHRSQTNVLPHSQQYRYGRIPFYIPYAPCIRSQGLEAKLYPTIPLAYPRKKLFATKKAFAGLSAMRRMKYGYHSVPKGVYTRMP